MLGLVSGLDFAKFGQPCDIHVIFRSDKQLGHHTNNPTYKHTPLL